MVEEMMAEYKSNCCEERKGHDSWCKSVNTVENPEASVTGKPLRILRSLKTLKPLKVLKLLKSLTRWMLQEPAMVW